MKRFFLFLLLLGLTTVKSLATGEPSTYFNIYVPSNNDAVKRNVALIVTAIQDSTYFSIVDDDMDGDSDDTVEGWLNAGQSYILYIKDNGINDDAKYASGGELKSDGDYFTIQSSKLVYASMSTDSDWQHDFVAAINKKSVGLKFYVYAPKISSSNRDLNVFAYEDNTSITISRISQSSTFSTGYTNVDVNQSEIVVQKTLNVGEDLIHYYTEGRDVMSSGETYMIESNKPVSLQYGALWGNSRDGGAYVPSFQGSSSGDLFYFAVPYQANGEQEIRMVSWDDNNEVQFDRFDKGSWISMGSWNISKFGTADWVGKENDNSTFATVFRVKCTEGKSISVFEANWMETGSIGTSDMASMMSSSNGSSSGKEFLAYIAPPGNQKNVRDPFTGNTFGGSFSHLFIFAGNTNATVSVVDAKTGGELFSKSVSVDSARYADIKISEAEWKSIYNGTGYNSGSDRPYLLINSDQNISVLNTNFNDNWMTYFGSSLKPAFDQSIVSNTSTAIPGDTSVLVSEIILDPSVTVQNPDVKVVISSGATAVRSSLTNTTTQVSVEGDIVRTNENTTITFDSVPDITTQDKYEVNTEIVLSTSYNDGTPIEDNTVISVETVVSGEIDGYVQESVVSQGIENETSNTSALVFNTCSVAEIENKLWDTWNSSWVDFNNDGWDDLWVNSKSTDQVNYLYQNVDGVLSEFQGTGQFFNEKAKTVTTVWGDINNDGYPDPFVVNATEKGSMLYLNYGNGNFEPLTNSGIYVHPKYFHGASFADFDNDGFLDLLITNFFQTEFHQLYRNNGDMSFTLLNDNAIATVSARATAPVLADYNNDGLVDVFIPNGNNEANSLFKNLGNFTFEKVSESGLENELKNSVGASWGDFDRDGDFDLFVTNSSDQFNDLYLNNGDDTFTRDSQSLLSNQKGHSHGAIWKDVENDGDLDLLVNNDQGRNFLYINDGTGDFYQNVDETISGDIGNAYGVATSDYNNDGAADFFISTHGNQANRLFCNQNNSNHWIQIKLVGNKSNKKGIGAVVKVKSGGQWQMQQVQPISGFGSQHSLTQTFGLGNNSQADSVQIVWPSGLVQNIVSPLLDTLHVVEEPDANRIIFVVFNDSNNDGLLNINEERIKNINLSINPIGRIIRTNANGKIQTSLPAGEYEIAIENSTLYQQTVPISFTVSGAVLSDAIAVPLSVVTLGFDLDLEIVRTPLRRGFSNNTVVQVRNKGSVAAENVELLMTYPSDIVIKNSSETLQIPETSVYSVNLGDLGAGDVYTMQIEDSVGLNLRTGDFVNFSSEVSAVGLDLDLTNNTVQEDIEIVGAIDPNDLLVSPKGYGDKGWISKEQWLTFTIRFQNVGSYFATFVRLQSSLDQELDLSTFEFIASSHEADITLTQDRNLEVFYDHIMLPSTEVNELESHGFFKFRIKPKYDLQGGEQIETDADIVFDYEDAIQTNRIQHSIKFQLDSDQVKLSVYPNPSIDQIKVNTHKNYFTVENLPAIAYYSIRDLSGTMVMEKSNLKEDRLQVSITGLKNGLYMIEILDESGQRFNARFIKR
ncbi:Repeat domain-containing protein [Marivirga sericea]|uniref:Repeat domain-containing protein n=1 Tax=Marivirga sericea TaxID=1028 RepID=A0A1X7IA07_9BACT|nr:FG-GAP-like repeat-containing protein [Marivirga sericea]SMG11239.1 Repeat domain-containing protein [Marivirga sericea]